MSEENKDILNKNEKKEKKGFFARLKEGLAKTRNNIVESFADVFGASHIDDDFYENLEETFIMADMGYETTEKVIEDLKQRVEDSHIKEPAACKELVINIIRDQMSVDESAYDFENKKTVVLVIGVNGVGKTTTIGKLAAQYRQRGKRVLMAAADTFRAAAIDQLKTWADRAQVDIISHNEGADQEDDESSEIRQRAHRPRERRRLPRGLRARRRGRAHPLRIPPLRGAPRSRRRRE